MSKLYDITILGADDQASWITAAAFAALDLRVALVLEKTPDPDLLCFPWTPIDISRYPALVSDFNLKTRGAPHPLHTDFQILIAGRMVDIMADPDAGRRNLYRDLGQKAEEFMALSEELDGISRDILSAALENSFVQRALLKAGESAWGRLLRGKSWTPPPEPGFREWARGKSPELVAIIQAAAQATLAAPLPENPPLHQVALLWSFCRHPGAGPGSKNDLREQALALLTKRGTVMQAEPDAPIVRGKTVHSLRLKGGAIIDTRVLLARSEMIDKLPGVGGGRNKSSAGNGREVFRSTFFFRIEKSTIPESLAARAVVVHDPGKSMDGSNLMTIVISPRVPRRSTLSVTMFTESNDIEPSTIPEKLASSLDWLDPDRITPDETREPVFTLLPSRLSDAGVTRALVPTPIENVLLLPSDPLAGWGPVGVKLSLRLLIDQCAELISKNKTSGW